MQKSNKKAENSDDILSLAKKVRDACIEAAGNGFQDAKMSGLCNDGAIEAAVGAIQSLDLEKIVQESKS